MVVTLPRTKGIRSIPQMWPTGKWVLRVQCRTCYHEGLVDEVLPHEPIRQWVLSFPFQLKFLFASRPKLMGKALVIVHCATPFHLIKKAGKAQKPVQTGSVTLIQRFGRFGPPSALNLNPNAARSISTGCSLMGFIQKKIR
jgi:hypothetical protein